MFRALWGTRISAPSTFDFGLSPSARDELIQGSCCQEWPWISNMMFPLIESPPGCKMRKRTGSPALATNVGVFGAPPVAPGREFESTCQTGVVGVGLLVPSRKKSSSERLLIALDDTVFGVDAAIFVCSSRTKSLNRKPPFVSRMSAACVT